MWLPGIVNQLMKLSALRGCLGNTARIVFIFQINLLTHLKISDLCSVMNSVNPTLQGFQDYNLRDALLKHCYPHLH